MPPYLLVLESSATVNFSNRLRDLIRRDTDAGVDDVDHEIVAKFVDLTLGDDLNLAVVREFHRVIQQLTRHVAEFAGIAKGRSKIRSESCR